jgi:ABC-type Fe3+-hydroxamate transport system substrate-binding protein
MPYKRIISLVPSLTELLFDLGLSSQVVGRTRFCIHPSKQISNTPIVGGTKNPNIGKIRELQPDLVIANKEENRKIDIDTISEFCEVIVTEIDSIETAAKWIHRIGIKLDRANESETLFGQLIKFIPTVSGLESIPTAYFIWKDPWMSIGQDTYIHDVMKLFRLENVYGDKNRYPITDIDEISKLSPRLILLSSEPFPFSEKHVQEIQDALPNTKIELIDGEWFSWYGSRMLPAFKKLKVWREDLSI